MQKRIMSYRKKGIGVESSNIEVKVLEEGTKGLASRAMLEQLDKVNISNNDELNKALYETLRGIKDPLDSHVMNSELQFNL